MTVVMTIAIEIDTVAEDRFKIHSEVKPRTLLPNCMLRKDRGEG